VSLISGEHFKSGFHLPYLRDVYDHVALMLQQLEQAATTLSLLQDTYNGGVSIRQAHVCSPYV
jgi:Mg2+ and Co2+ transporter CorA